MIFQRKLYTQWFLFLDDLTVATGKPKSLPPGPSGAADVVESNLAFSVAASVERETRDRVGEPCPPLCLSGVPETARLPSPEGLPACARKSRGAQWDPRCTQGPRTLGSPRGQGGRGAQGPRANAVWRTQSGRLLPLLLVGS